MNQIDNLIAASTDESCRYTIAAAPKYAGDYRMGGGTFYTQFSLCKKPCWLHRKMVKLLLGWEWVDNK